MGRAVPARVAAVMAPAARRGGGGQSAAGTGRDRAGADRLRRHDHAGRGHRRRGPAWVVAGVGAAPETSLAETAGIDNRRRPSRSTRASPPSAPGRLRGRGLLSLPAPALQRPPVAAGVVGGRRRRSTAPPRAGAMLGGTGPLRRASPGSGPTSTTTPCRSRGLADARVRRGSSGSARTGTEIWFGLADGGRLVAAAAAGPGKLRGQGHQAGRDADRAARGPRTPPPWPIPAWR